MADQDMSTGETGTEGLVDAYKRASTPTPAPANIAEEVGLPVRPLSKTPQVPPGPLQNDVARILKEVQLPTRRDFRASADAPLATPPQPEPDPVRELAVAPEPKPRDIVSAVHTLKDDFQSAVQDRKISLVQAAALEQDKRAHRAISAPDPQREAQRQKTVRLLAIIASFVAIGVVASTAAFLIIQDRASVAPVTFLVDGLLFSEQTIPLPLQNLDAADIKFRLGQARSSSGLTLGAIARIAPVYEEQVGDQEPVMREATTQEFLTALGTRIPDELMRALGTVFFFGFHAVDENAPLLIIPVTSYERAFAGMLAWEKTINADLSPIFTSMSGVKQENGQLVERLFSDAVMRNYDVRVLRDDKGVVQLYYSFPTRDILIIAESQFSFAEILARLRAERRL